MSDTLPETDDRPIVGSVLGKYRVTAELSRGGMGTVYVAQHELLGRRAAIKVLRPELTTNAELVQRFFTEAKAATAIAHPGIVEVFDYGHADDGRAFLTMELLEGATLARRIEQRKRLTELEVAQLARGIAHALAAAHAKGIVHRDLKPDNVFLVADPDVPGGERPKLLDFGIAKLVDPVGLKPDHRQTVTGALMGTPLYMAPEQARAAGEIDARADLYSLGCMMYEMLVGEPPFVAVGAGEIIALQLFGKPIPPRDRLAKVSREMDALVMQLLEKEPGDRLQTATAVIDAIDGALGKMSARLTEEIEPPVRRVAPTHLVVVQRSRAPFVLAGVAVIAVVAAVAIIVIASHDGAPREQPNAAAPAVQQPGPAKIVTVPVVVPVVETGSGSASMIELSKHHAQPVRHPRTDKGSPIADTDLSKP